MTGWKRSVYVLGGRLVKPVASRTGWLPPMHLSLECDLSNVKWGYDEEDEIKDATRVVRDYTMVSLPRLASLWLQVRYVDKHRIPGALVECGVWRGGAIAMMALAHMRSHEVPWRSLHLFDSFEGLPEPRADVDGIGAIQFARGRADGKLVPVGQCVSSADDSRDLLLATLKYPVELVHYHNGWFQVTIERDGPEVGPIAVLRLDGDWYESTKVCLEHLYPHVARHGVVVIDDYAFYEGCRRAVDEFLSNQVEPVMLHHIDQDARYWIKPA